MNKDKLWKFVYSLFMPYGLHTNELVVIGTDNEETNIKMRIIWETLEEMYEYHSYKFQGCELIEQ